MINTKKVIGKRVIATLIVYTLIFLLTFAYIQIFGEINKDGEKSVHGPLALFPLIYWFIYFVLIELKYAGTLGHLIVGLKIVSLNSSKITFLQILKRRLADIVEISWCFALLAFIIAKGNNNSQRLGDILAKTIVVDRNEDLEKLDYDFQKLK